MKRLFQYIILGLCITSVSSCSNDDELPSIFDTTTAAVDTSKATAPFDQWLYDNFVVPYNVEVQYKFNFTASDLSYRLTPAEYGRSQLLSHLIRHLFFDVYSKYSPEGEDFMKKYGPRMFHFIGSSGYSATTSTETLGTASGGVKITLYAVNEMKPYNKGTLYTANDIDRLNDRYFHTMHHEFSHILHQTKSYPVTFGQVTSGTYKAKDWQERDTTETCRLGYVTNYASSRNTEDFVETLSCIITDTDWRWMHRIIAASINGVRSGDAALIENLVDSLNIQDINNPNAHWNDFTVYKESKYNSEEDKYEDTGNFVLDIYRSKSSIYSNARGQYIKEYNYTKERSYTSFLNDFLPNLSVKTEKEVAGINAILKKIEIATQWYTDKWKFNIYDIRREVSERQKNINDYIFDESKVQIYSLK